MNLTYLAPFMLSLAFAAPRAAGERVVGASGYPMRAVPAGIYKVGCTPGQGPDCSAGPVRRVETFPLLVGEVEVTRGLYRKVVGGAPDSWECSQNECPAVMVTWRDAVEFANAMSRYEGLSECYVITETQVSWKDEAKETRVSWKGGALCAGYRLPSVDEWEVAARGGQDFKFSGSDSIDSVGWYRANSGDRLHAVAGKASNAYGLYDMTGNAAEIVWPSEKITVLVTGAADGSESWLKGNSYPYGPLGVADTRVTPAQRYSNVGFRLVRTDLESKTEAERQMKEAEALARDAFLAESSEVNTAPPVSQNYDVQSKLVVIYYAYMLSIGFCFGVRRFKADDFIDIWIIAAVSITAPVWIPLWAGYKLLYGKEP